MRILIAGGGTGGHVFPAIAIADAIKKARPNASILFVGAEGKMEMERVPKAGYEIKGLPVSGFQRGFSLESLLKNLSFPFKLWKSMARAKAIVREFQPEIAIGVGGYASGPAVKAAIAAGVPGLIQEQNSFAGVTNKMLGKRAQLICVAYSGMEAFFPKEKIRLTGNPVRQDLQFLEKKRAEAMEHYGLNPQKKTIAILGGSLGARSLNNAMRDNQAFFLQNPHIQVLWQCGRFYEKEFSRCETAQLPQVKLLPFLERMDLAYAAADVVVARAGALTISEICVAGKPAVLLPSPNVAEDHQTKNAQALVGVGAAVLVQDKDATAQMLEQAKQILKSDKAMDTMKLKLDTLSKPNAAAEIATLCIELIEKGK